MLAADMHVATHTRLRDPVSIESGSTGGADWHNILTLLLRKAPLARQKTRHGCLDLRRNRLFPVGMVKISWLLLHIADGTCCYLHGALIVESFQKSLDGVDFAFCRDRVAPITPI